MAVWTDMVKTEFTITTGDGAVYKPKTFNANKSVEYNLAEFNFRNLSGTLVDRRKPMGTVYDLELYFEGGDCIDKALAFQNSAANSKRWEIVHPFYKKLKVQPIGPVKYDNADNLLNVTKIMVTVRESLTASDITFAVSRPDVITTLQKDSQQAYAEYYVTEVPEVTADDISQMRDNQSKFQTALRTVSEGANEITNAYNAANSAINNALGNVSNAIASIQYYLSLPAFIADTVINRLRFLAGELMAIIDQIYDLNIPSLQSLWYTECGTILSGMCVCTVTETTTADYEYSSQVTEVIQIIVAHYNEFLIRYYFAQAYNGAEVGAFIADPQSFEVLDNLVNYTIATLFEIQSQAKQPKTLTLTRASNVITLTWRIYGLTPDDSTLDKLIADNNIVGDELIQVPIGKQIVYYV